MDRRQPITRRLIVSGQRGLTLIELLVVMAILALAATIVLINAPPRQSAARAAASEFADALRAAVDDAVVSGGVHRLEVAPDKWRISEYEDRDWTAFRQGSDTDDLSLIVDVEEVAKSNFSALTGERGEQRERDAPVIIAVDPFGDAPPFTLHFRSDRESWSVQHTADGNIGVARE